MGQGLQGPRATLFLMSEVPLQESPPRDDDVGAIAQNQFRETAEFPRQIVSGWCLNPYGVTGGSRAALQVLSSGCFLGMWGEGSR